MGDTSCNRQTACAREFSTVAEKTSNFPWSAALTWCGDRKVAGNGPRSQWRQLGLRLVFRHRSAAGMRIPLPSRLIFVDMYTLSHIVGEGRRVHGGLPRLASLPPDATAPLTPLTSLSTRQPEAPTSTPLMSGACR